MSVAAAIGVCLQLAATPTLPPHFIPTSHFTLVWMHTIEKVKWEEDYSIHSHPHTGKIILEATEARIKGTGAGMEPPSDAQLKNGWYVYTPTEKYPAVLRLTRSEYSADYQWCDQKGCVPLSAKIPRDGGITLLTACQQPSSSTDLL